MRRVKIKAEMTCSGCGYFEKIEYNLQEGLNTIVWTCPTCGMKRTMTRIIEKKKKERESSGNLTRIGKPTSDKPEVD